MCRRERKITLLNYYFINSIFILIIVLITNLSQFLWFIVNKPGSGNLPYLKTASYIYEHCQNGTRDHTGTQKVVP